jgi:hypothetical protein
VGFFDKLPPLWAVPFVLTKLPRMSWLQRRKDYPAVMELAREVIGSPVLKTKAYAGYVPAAHDVFVCTYSKSGTYWMLQVVTQIAGRGAAELGHVHDVAPWPETLMPGIVRLRVPTWRSAPTGMRAIKTHAEARYVPYGAAAKYVVVVRDPKDALVSSFYFADSIMPGLTSIGLSAWTDAFVAGASPFGSWAEHVAGFWPWRTRDNVLVIDYAELKRDLEGSVRRVASMMGVELRPDELAAVVERCGFGYMKRHEDQFRPPVPGPNGRRVELLRHGRQGEGRELLTSEQVARVDAAMRQELLRLGSDFPYDERYGG